MSDASLATIPKSQSYAISAFLEPSSFVFAARFLGRLFARENRFEIPLKLPVIFGFIPQKPSSHPSLVLPISREIPKRSTMSSRAPLGREHDRIPRPASFHGPLPAKSDAPTRLQRPESHPELLRRSGAVAGNPMSPESRGQRLTKLLLNVTVQRSLGPVHVVISPESSVADLIKAALDVYVKEGRRPLLTETDPQGFELHYSQFSLESLNPKEKLINLGSRNFFLCPKQAGVNNKCSDEATKANKPPLPWLIKFTGFSL